MENPITKLKAQIEARNEALLNSELVLEEKISKQNDKLLELSKAYKFLNLYNHNPEEIIEPVTSEMFTEKINKLNAEISAIPLETVEDINNHEKLISEIFYLTANRLLTIRNFKISYRESRYNASNGEIKLNPIYQHLKNTEQTQSWKEETRKLLDIHFELLNGQSKLLQLEEELTLEEDRIYQIREIVYNHAIRVLEY